MGFKGGRWAPPLRLFSRLLQRLWRDLSRTFFEPNRTEPNIQYRTVFFRRHVYAGNRTEPFSFADKRMCAGFHDPCSPPSGIFAHATALIPANPAPPPICFDSQADLGRIREVGVLWQPQQRPRPR